MAPIFSHDTISDFIKGQEISVRFTCISFIGEYFCDRLLGMATVTVQ